MIKESDIRPKVHTSNKHTHSPSGTTCTYPQKTYPSRVETPTNKQYRFLIQVFERKRAFAFKLTCTIVLKLLIYWGVQTYTLPTRCQELPIVVLKFGRLKTLIASQKSRNFSTSILVIWVDQHIHLDRKIALGNRFPTPLRRL